MNKSSIKNYAVWARTELIKLVTQKAYEYEVTKERTPSYNVDSVHGRLLDPEEKKQLNELVTEVKKNGFDHVIEEVAYTWFNRFIALRYMEVNNYIPQRVRTFTNEKNEFKPELLSEAIHLDMDGLDKQRVLDYIENNDQEALYKYLLLTICNDMNQYLPDMFTSISDYKTLLFPDNLLKEDGVLARLIKDIDQDSWNDQVQIIGWLYQYYIQMPKDELIHAKKQYKNEDVPFVTQLFTPDWVVRYMVENSLGNYYLKINPNTELYKDWKYFIKNNSTQEFNHKKLEDIIESYIKGIDVDNNNIYLDDDDLIVSGTQNTQNTWMDAKYDGVAITPRSGKAVEVNSLWYNANKIMADLSKKFGHSQNAKKYKLIAEKCKKSFNDKFYNKRRKCLYDVLGDSKIRPNQLFALSLTYPVIEADSEEAKNIISVVEKKLLNAYGLKTLAKGEENYVEVYEGDGKKRDSSYHQGITWPWLLGLYYNALKNILKKTKKKDAKKELETKLEKFIEKTSKTFQKEISHNGCIGSISELYDSRKPYLPKGTIAQAWSVAEVFRIILNK